MTYAKPADCMHAAMVADGDDRLCRACGLRLPNLTAAEAIAAARAALHPNESET